MPGLTGPRIAVTRALLLPLLTLSAAACSAERATAPDEAPPARETLTVSYRGYGPYASLDLLHLWLGDGPEARRLRSGDFQATGDGSHVSSGWAVPTKGFLNTTVGLVTAQQDTLAMVGPGVAVRSDRTYRISIQAGGARPRMRADVCEQATAAAPLTRQRQLNGDTLFIQMDAVRTSSGC